MTNQRRATPTSYVRRDESLSIFRSQWLITILDPGEFRQANVSLTSGWLIHQLHPHHRHTRFYQSVGASGVCDVKKWDPFPTYQIWTSGLWLSWHFPQFLSFYDLFPLSKAPGETRSTRPSPSTWRFELSLVLRAFRFCLLRFTNHQYAVSFLISRNSATFSISPSIGLLLTLW